MKNTNESELSKSLRKLMESNDSPITLSQISSILDKQIYTQKEVAALIGVTTKTIYNWRRTNKLKCRNWSGRPRYTLQDMVDLLNYVKPKRKTTVLRKVPIRNIK